MAWHLSGQLIETCSCNMFCPCWFLVQDLMIMDQGWCSTGLGFRVQQGEADGADLGGHAVVLGTYFPGPTMFDGDARARLYLDNRASADQQRELEAIFTGKRGGPMALLAGLVSSWLPTQSARLDVTDDGDRITIKVGEAGEVRSQLLRDGEGSGFTLRGGGFIAGLGMEHVELAPSRSRWTDAELHLFETKSGARGSFTWSG